MRGFAADLVAGALIMAATKLIASPAVLESPVGAQSTIGQGSVMQWVDRTHKGDRLDAANHNAQQPRVRKPERILTGCEPAISPLSASARAGNFARRCVARARGVTTTG
jgi:hypothetical protein